MDPNISKATTGRERGVAACAESQSASRDPNRTRFLAVQAAIRVKMQCDKKSLLASADASNKRNLMAVGRLLSCGNKDRNSHIRWDGKRKV
jgi:hypothetical protein